MKDNVVILGCPRSGTSILGELFEELAEFNYYFEPGVGFLRRSGSEVGRWAVKNPIDLAAGNRDMAIARRTRGLGFDLNDLVTRMKPVRFVWIVRHPLDTVCSLVPGLSDGWNHGPEPTLWKELMDLTPQERGAHMWRWVNEAGFQALEPLNPLIVHYEELVEEPESTVDDVLDFVQAEPDDLAVRRYLRKVSATTDGYQAKHQERWSSIDGHRPHVGRWKHDLSRDQILRVVPIVRDVAKDFGYEVSA